MKKFIAFVLCLIISATMVSCYNSTNNDDEQNHDSANNTGTPNRDQLENDEMSDQDKIAWQAYCEAIKSERVIYRYSLYSSPSVTPSSSYFHDCVDDTKPFEQAMVDMDQDGISELILKYSHPDRYVILHYENGRVYYNSSLIPFYNATIYTNGSFSWSNYSDIFGKENGISRITYLNGRPKYQELCRVEASYNMYYVNGAPVSEEEYDNYIDSTSWTPITFSPIDLSLLDSCGRKALRLASEYWNIKDGDFDPQIGARYQLYVEKNYYAKDYTVYLYTFIPSGYYECIALAYVDIDTEEINVVRYPYGKG